MINSVNFTENCDRVQLVYYYKVNKSYGKLSRLSLLESSTTSVTTLFRFQEVSFRSQAGVQKVMDTRSN